MYGKGYLYLWQFEKTANYIDEFLQCAEWA